MTVPSRRTSPVVMITLLLAVIMAVVTACGQVPGPSETDRTAGPDSASTPAQPPGIDRARQNLGASRSDLPWLSGVWPGGDTITGARAEAFGAWRGLPADAATTYPASKTWQSIHDSTWHITTYDGFAGVLIYGLPMLPSEDAGSFASILRGDHDWVYRKVAHDLVAYGRGRSVVRIGWEANGDWFSWNTTAAQAEDYRRAFRHIVGVLRSEAPDLVIDFDIACGTELRGQSDRLDALTTLYPGDDVVDLVGCDTYDWYHTSATSQRGWDSSIKPVDSVGLQDVVDFARAHGKGFSVPEWGLASRAEGGAGDNPYYIQKMRTFFEANADVLVLESYFNEPMTSIANSLWSPTQAPKAALVYRKLW